MEIVQTSALCQWLFPVWRRLRGAYAYSLLAKIFAGIDAGWRCGCSGSVLIRFLTREGVLSRAWRNSLLCRILTLLINLPTVLFRWLYECFQPVFENSIFARIGFGLVEETPAAVGWLILCTLVIPYKQWSNGYSLGGFVVLGLFAVLAGMRKRQLNLDLVSMGPWLVAFAGMVCAAWPTSMYPSKSLRFLAFHFTCMLCMIILVSTVERRDQLVRLAAAASTGLLMMSAYGVVQRIQGVEVNLSYVDLTLNKDMPGRIYSFYENPNAFGEVLVLLIPVAVALMLCSRRWLGRFWGFLSAALGIVALAMTYSRAGWVGMVCAIFLFVLLWHKKLIPVLILVGLMTISFLPDTMFNRILTMTNMQDTSTNSRFPLYQAAARFLKLHPIQGAGLGTDAVRAAIRDLNLFHGHDHFVHCHDIFLQIWCETGLLGLIAFVGSMGWTLKKAARAVSRGACHQQTRMVIIGSVSGLMGTLVCGIADYIWNYPRVMLIFWFVCALTVAGVKLAAREAHPAELSAHGGGESA